jgi:hypothetical protein
MEYLVIYANGISQSFYNLAVAEMYRNINGGFIVNLMETETEQSENEEFV